MPCRREVLALFPSFLAAGCTDQLAGQRPTATPTTDGGTTTDECENGGVVIESTRETLTDDQREWVKPVRYDDLSPRLQEVADRVVESDIQECYPPSSDVEAFIDRVAERQEKQAAEYLDEHSSNRLPGYVDVGYLAVGEDLYSLFIRVQDVIVSG